MNSSVKGWDEKRIGEPDVLKKALGFSFFRERSKHKLQRFQSTDSLPDIHLPFCTEA